MIKTVVRRDVKFEEERAFRKSHDTVPVAARYPELEALKLEDTQVP